LIIYKAENKINGQVYIGKTISSLADRRQQHIYFIGRNRNTYFHNAMKAHGIDNFEWSILAETDCESKLNALEKFYITMYRKMGSVYNLTDGGEGSSGRVISEETRKKMSEAQKGKKGKPVSEENRRKRAEVARNMSEEQRKIIAECNRNRIHTEESRRKTSERFKGKKHSEETRKKMSEAGKGRKFTEEHKQKIGLANKRRVWTEESRRKASESRKGRPAWNKGLKNIRTNADESLVCYEN